MSSSRDRAAIALDAAAPGDAEAAVALMMETDPALFRYLGGGDPTLSVRLVVEMWRGDDTILSHRFGRVQREGGDVIALVVAMAGRQRHALLDATNERAAALVPAERAERLFAAWSAVDWLFPAIPAEAWYVQNLAVVAGRRRAGIGGALLAAALADGREDGCAAVHLDVAADNPAIRLYERAGFARLVESRVPALEAHAIAPHWRMALDLRASSR